MKQVQVGPVAVAQLVEWLLLTPEVCYSKPISKFHGDHNVFTIKCWKDENKEKEN